MEKRKKNNIAAKYVSICFLYEYICIFNYVCMTSESGKYGAPMTDSNFLIKTDFDVTCMKLKASKILNN